MCICHISIKHYLLTAIRARFGKKLRAQEPKSLPPDAFPGLQICQNAFAGPPSWIKGGLLLRGGEGKRKGRGGKGRGEGKGEEGKERRGGEGKGDVAPPLLKFLDPPLLTGIKKLRYGLTKITIFSHIILCF